MNPELSYSQYYNVHEESPELKEGVFKHAYEKAIKYHANNENRLYGSDLLLYGDIFTSNFIKDYNAKFSEFNNPNKNHPDHTKQLSIIQEAMDHESIKKYEWLGREYQPLKLSAIDDKYNSTDMVIVNRYENDEGMKKVKTGLAIDVTYSEKGYVEKLKNIDYYLKEYPFLLKNQLFFDPETHNIGSKLIPQVALHDTRKNLETRMAHWLDLKNVDTTMRNDLTQLSYLSQALFQSVTFAKRYNPRKQGSEHHTKHYKRNAKLLQNALMSKVLSLNKLPNIELVVESLAEATGQSSVQIKNNVCNYKDQNNSILHRLVWNK